MKTITLIIYTCSYAAWASADLNEMRKYLPADKWVLTSYLAKEYDVYPLDREILFYDNPEFVGEHKVSVANKIIEFENGDKCVLGRSQESARVARWLACLPFQCDVRNANPPSEVTLINPWKIAWYKYLPQKVASERCSRQVDAFIHPRRVDDHVYSYHLYVSSNDRTLSVDGKKYYPKFENCNRDRFSLPCRLKLNAKTDEFSVTSLVEKAKKSTATGNLDVLRKCFDKKDPTSCVQENTIIAEEPVSNYLSLNRHTSIEPAYGPIKWNADLLIELKACLDKKQLVGFNTYMGNAKKCMFYNSKVLYVDFPEAFLEFETLGTREINLKFPGQ